MQQLSRRSLPHIVLWDGRNITVSAILTALLILAMAAFFLGRFRDQRAAARANEQRFVAWEGQLLTATPAALERGRLEGQLAALQGRFAVASGDLPGTSVQDDALERITVAAEQSGVELTALRELGEQYSDGSVVAWLYEVGARGSLPALTEFARRLEADAFPAAYLSEPVLNEQADGSYRLSSTLNVYGSTLSTASLPAAPPVVADDLATQLRADAEAALARGDFPAAISALLQLAAIAPAPEVEQRLYEAHVAYGEALLDSGQPAQALAQFQAALAINPSGQGAMAGIVTANQQLAASGPPTVTQDPIAVIGSATPTATLFAAIPTPFASATIAFSSPIPPAPATVPGKGPPTVPLPPTRTPLPPPTSGPTRTELPIASATLPLATPAGSPTATATASLTVTPGSTTPGTTPSATSTVAGTANPFPFGSLSPFYLPNCGLTQIKGTIRDSQTNRPVNGVTVRVWWDGAGPTEIYSLPTGSDPTRGPGEWDVVLANFPKAGQWYVAVVDPITSTLYSPIQTLFTDTNSCQPGGNGHQVIIQDFLKFGDGPGVPGATLTPSRTPSPAPSPSATPTISPTPTVTMTPTPTPITAFKNEEPDLLIPDGPGGTANSTVAVAESATVRLLRVFLNIEHQDAGDLRITLVHPDGTRVLVHDQGEDSGKTEIRRWFTVSGFQGKGAAGMWTLEVVDTIEGRTGTLLSWTLEIYP